MAIKDSVESFANETSMHGASKIILNKSRIGRWIWLLTFFGAWTMFAIQICSVIQNYFAYQTKVNIEVGYGGVPFPDVTICSNRGWDFYETYKIAADDKFGSHAFFHLWSSRMHNITLYNKSRINEMRSAFDSVLYNSESDENFEELIDKIAFNSSQSVKFMSEIHAALELKDATSVYPSEITFHFNKFRTSHRSYAMSVFDFDIVTISKEEFIVDCTYNRKKCEDIGLLAQFSHPYHTRCFTYSTNTSRLVQGVDHGWSSILMSGDGMLRSIHDKSPIPMHGLYDMGNAIAGKSGARVVLHPPGTRPSPVGKGFDVPPGHAVSLGITPKTTTRLGPPYGNCITYPLNEFALRGAENQEDCLLMCAQLNTIKLCKCFDSNLPRLTGMKCHEQRVGAVRVTNCTVRLSDANEDRRICECSQGCEGLSFLEDRKQSVLDDVACTKQVSSVMKPEECMCPPPCEEYGYDVTYSLTSWPAENSEDGAFVDIFYVCFVDCYHFIIILFQISPAGMLTELDSDELFVRTRTANELLPTQFIRPRKVRQTS